MKSKLEFIFWRLRVWWNFGRKGLPEPFPEEADMVDFWGESIVAEELAERLKWQRKRFERAIEEETKKLEIYDNFEPKSK